ncbi:putative NT-type C2 domain, protein PLASTID MOVEMENT IMPAIRED 1 [Helianthus annuus]|uniref:NT-type C2 domain, protein PLASTID MOVEMENT IMPAIRED 1 n=1 Tax=Helianthus annuus TaxID=4232 RepID=A0A251TTX9_HELAN|nr:protein PLASTID MOVEMENT IMPAIRED 1-RELATED 1 [Helianthus annuus]XP_021980877.1 protein PLASTID MOVEMENT IMPAIRED 1-RELATED 1 [Helianthus annuus]XP_021980878.1 protein PLASTID MOVEMENT IMPAIRED 1-RELATED 1 [Helianthus annuus]KAF5788683.1 putative NT-type C2 domain, protein PLASTID MOVEMENT IMPAIRED 1 [Helianthus annuus]
MSRNVLNKKTGDTSTNSNDLLLNDINILSKALYHHHHDHKPNPRTRSKLPQTNSNSKDDRRFLKDNKSSLWGWNTFKSFNHIRNKRFNCCFSLQVHSIEQLPPSFENLALCVKWKRRDGEFTTRPAKVSQGVAQFEELLLTNTCSVYGSRSGPHHSAKYEAKHFLLYASLVVDPELDLGKHRVDLTRLLPLTLEELESEKSSGKWTTSYRLSGKAKGASMNVSFGYSVVGSGDGVVKSPVKTSGQSQSQIKRGESLPANSRSVENVRDLHEILPVSKSGLSESVSVLYKKLEEEEEKSIISVDYETQQPKPSNQDLNSTDHDDSNIIRTFSVMEQGIEYPTNENVKQEKKAFDGSESSTFERDLDVDSLPVKEFESQNEEFGDKELLLQELELALNNAVDLKEESDSQEENENINKSGFRYEEKVKVGYNEKGKSLELDYATEAVAEDFLDILGIDHSPVSLTSESEPNSPRERLLRQFEKDSMANGSSLFNFDIDDDDGDVDVDILTPTPEEPLNKTKASVLEDMETEALMREWGLNKNVFQGSPSSTTPSGSSGPVDPSLPPLGEGLGSFVQTGNGGFLRSMNPEIFKNAKSGGNLIMQVSSPVVVPAEMGSGIMDVLQCLASVGIEKLSMQANKLMPLEDISGKTMQQIVWESTPSLEAPHGQHSLHEEPVVEHVSTSHGSKRYEADGADQEYVSLEDLAPLAMNKIEALSIEGLRIQSGMSDKEAPSNISPQSIGEISALEGKRVNFDGSLGLEGTGGLQLLDVKNNRDGNSNGNSDDIDGIMGLSVTLDEWMRLDSGEIDDGDEISERTSRILAAHHASDLMRARRGKGSRKGGLLGNNFTVALMVQLRDPLRNFEPVGTPMLALVQVERVFIPPKPKIYTSVYSLYNKPEEDEVDEVKVEEKKVSVEEKKARVEVEESELVPKFKITEVHVAGVKTEPERAPNKKGIWGSNAKQQQSGSRWLVANGMGKKNTKHPLMKSKVDGKSSGSLWSISSKGKGKGKGKVEPPVRNPNVIIPNETVKLLSGTGFI